MQKKRIIKLNKNSTKESIKKNDNIIKEDEFWEDKFEINEDFQKNNINKNKQKEIIKNKNNIKDINSSIIINKALNDKIRYNNYFIKMKNDKKLNNKIKIQKSKSASKNRFNKLYLEGLISIKKRLQKSMEQKIEKENEYKKYSFSPKLYNHSSSHKKNKNQRQSIDNIKKNIFKNNKNDIYERNKKWKKAIEDKKTKQRILMKKNTEVKRKVKPSINDSIMKTDESFINKNSIEYQAFIDKVKLMKNKENIYGKNERNSNLYKNNKIKYSIELKKRNIIKNNKIKEMKKFKSFNNREIYNINICRKKYGLNEFFNSNNYETILCQNNDKNNFNYNNKFLINQRDLDMNEQFFIQQIFKSSETDSINTINSIMRQSCFNFNDALKKLAGKIN